MLKSYYKSLNNVKIDKILDYLDNLYPNYENFLNFNNNFELLVAVILSAQTTDQRVNSVTKQLFARYGTPKDLSLANYDDVYNIIKPLGLAKSKAKNIILMSNELLTNFNGDVPSDFNDLLKLSGVGRKTANVVRAVGFKIPSMPVDTHVQRVAIRLGFATKDDSLLDVENKLLKSIPKDRLIKAHHQFILFGRNICLARNPHCNICLLKELCKEYEHRRRNSDKTK